VPIPRPVGKDRRRFISLCRTSEREDEPLSALTGVADWSFDDIRETEPARAGKLEAAGSPDELVAVLTAELRKACREPDRRLSPLGWERRNDAPDQHRAVVQFRVERDVYDWFFNARTGYRAHYRASPEAGIAFNGEIVEALRDVLAEHLPPTVRTVEIDIGMQRLGGARVPSVQFLHTLDPKLSKVWWGVTPVGGGDERAPGVTGPKLRVGGGKWWRAFLMEPDGWLDLKGAFANGDGRLDQPKSPMDRARKLHTDGEA
jgi:hypothetical protein